jgi:hypothetical protein
MWNLFKNVRVIFAVLVVGAIAAMAFWPDAIAVDVVSVSRGPMQVTIDEEGETRVRDRFVVSAPVAASSSPATRSPRATPWRRFFRPTHLCSIRVHGPNCRRHWMPVVRRSHRHRLSAIAPRPTSSARAT